MEAILLNNKAVDLLRQGQEVISDFRSALAELQRVDLPEEGVEHADKVIPNVCSVWSIPLDHSLFNTSSYQDHHAFSLFDRAMIIDGAKSAVTSSIEGRDRTAVVILFNTGLALHLRGIRDICSRQASFRKALQIYKMAFEILERSYDSYDEVNCLLCLATMNNMGHIYSHFCEGREAQHCLQLLHSMLETVKSSGIDVLSDEYLPFCMNALILFGQEVAAAAAA